MKSRRTYDYSRTAAACLLVVVACVAPVAFARAGDKLKPEEIVAKHLEAVGAAETRQSITSRIISGAVTLTFRSPSTGQGVGRAVLASKGEMNALGMIFDNSPNYPQEKVGFDGKEVTVSYVRPGVRSPLGDFLMTYRTIVRQGLVGGVLSESWPLYDLTEKKGKLESGGTKKIGDRQTYELKYMPRGGSDLRVSLFFDAETFQHIRTEYTRTLTAQMGRTPETSAQQSETRYKMTEEFSDFRKEAGLMLPHVYNIKLEIRSQGVSFDADWQTNFTRFAFNQRIDPSTFDVEGE